MSEPTLYLDGRVAVHAGDCAATIKTLADNSIDAVVTDPPYSLTSIVKRFGKTSIGDETDTSDRSRKGADGYARLAKGFMGKAWDNGSTAFSVDFWAEVWRVLKPGAHVVAFGGTRTYHRLAVAIEDAGFECRDAVMWHYGSGFPKSHSVSKALDRAAGAEREIVGVSSVTGARNGSSFDDGCKGSRRSFQNDETVINYQTAPASDAAREWAGWGTALKPATEIIFVGRKPLSAGTVAANVLRWGTGAINVDACRVESGGTHGSADSAGRGSGPPDNPTVYGRGRGGIVTEPHALGRWPANLVLDDSQEVRDAFPDVAAGSDCIRRCSAKPISVAKGAEYERESVGHADAAGSAARFFYSSKADADDRLGSKHPTVKPLDLMQWLCKLITPKGGTILDPFAGTGTTGEAAWREGFNAVLIEREAEYLDDIARRMKYALGGLDERKHVIIKAKGPVEAPGPLFGFLDDPKPAGGADRYTGSSPINSDDRTNGAQMVRTAE